MAAPASGAINGDDDCAGRDGGNGGNDDIGNSLFRYAIDPMAAVIKKRTGAVGADASLVSLSSFSLSDHEQIPKHRKNHDNPDGAHRQHRKHARPALTLTRLPGGFDDPAFSRDLDHPNLRCVAGAVAPSHRHDRQAMIGNR
jgi:hypothetical protein